MLSSLKNSEKLIDLVATIFQSPDDDQIKILILSKTKYRLSGLYLKTDIPRY